MACGVGRLHRFVEHLQLVDELFLGAGPKDRIVGLAVVLPIADAALVAAHEVEDELVVVVAFLAGEAGIIVDGCADAQVELE